MTKALNILVAGTGQAEVKSVRGLFRRAGLPARVAHAADLASTEAALGSRTIDCLFLDHALAGLPNLRRLTRALAAHGQPAGLVVLADRPSEALAVRCIRAGATDCLGREELSPARVARVIHDLHRLRRLEGELQKTQHLLTSVIDNAPIVLWATDRKGVFTLSEGRGLSLLGLKRGERVGLSLRQVYRERPDIVANLNSALSGKSVSHVSTAWGYTFDTRWGPLRDASGKIVGTIGLATDVTDRLLLQHDLQETEGRFRALADSAPVIIWMTAPDGSCSYLNQGWQDFTGKPVQQGRGRAWIDWVHPDDRGAWKRQMVAAHRGHKPVHIEFRLRSAGGEYRWMLCTGVPRMSKSGKLVGFVGTLVDITDHREATDVLRRSRDELERRVADLTADLTAANERFARELRERRQDTRQLREYQAQLRSLASTLALAEERERRRIAAGLHDLLAQKLALVRMKLGEITQGLEPRHTPALEEVREILVSAIAQTRSLSFEIGSPILYELGLDAALESLAETFEERHGIATVFRTRGRVGVLDQNTQAVLFQAARELLFNVAKHASASKIVLQIDHQRAHALLSVQDDGAGFDPAKAEPRRHRTSGYGLFNIRERLGHLGGQVRIASAPGEGTTITLIAPRRTGTRPPQKETAP
ncbi:MAG: PAS domain S-box protein [Planctomycetota bacterium]|nr:PAS domain S-box protein [Planctomycetota bacterium]